MRLLKKISTIFITIALVMLLLVGFLLPLQVLAVSPAHPDSPGISIVTALAFQNIYQKDDILIIFEYNIPYASVPTELCSDLFTTQLLNGSTVITNVLAIGTNAPGTLSVTKPLLNYHYNMACFYFTKADVANYGITWGTTTYKIEIAGTTLFSPAVIPVTYTLTPASGAGSKWETESDADTSRGLVQQYIINTVVGGSTGIGKMNTPFIQYLTTTSDATVLNQAGRTLVISAIKNLDTPIPQLFQLSNQQIKVEQPTSSGGLQTGLTLDNQLGSQISTAFTNFGNLLHISGQQVALGWILICCLILVSIVFLATGNLIGASICALPMVIIGVWIGAIPIAFVFTAVMVMVVLLAFFLFIRGM